MAVLTAVSILLAVNQVFNLGFFVGYVLLDSRYMYLITGVMLSMVFVTFPATKHSPRHVPWYDILIMLLIAGVFAYFAFYAERIVLEAWEYAAPPVGVWLALLTWAIGVDFPLLWGLLAFLFNYIPNIGSIIAAIPAVSTVSSDNNHITIHSVAHVPSEYPTCILHHLE